MQQKKVPWHLRCRRICTVARNWCHVVSLYVFIFLHLVPTFVTKPFWVSGLNIPGSIQRRWEERACENFWSSCLKRRWGTDAVWSRFFLKLRVAGIWPCQSSWASRSREGWLCHVAYVQLISVEMSPSSAMVIRDLKHFQGAVVCDSHSMVFIHRGGHPWL